MRLAVRALLALAASVAVLPALALPPSPPLTSQQSPVAPPSLSVTSTAADVELTDLTGNYPVTTLTNNGSAEVFCLPGPTATAALLVSTSNYSVAVPANAARWYWNNPVNLYVGCVTATGSATVRISQTNGAPGVAFLGGGGGGFGTVTSVGLALPGIFNVTGSPVTTSGTLTGALANETANLIFAGPSSGGAAAPTFRALAAADLPIASSSQIGGVQGDGSTVTISGPGVISVTTPSLGGNALFGTTSGNTNNDIVCMSNTTVGVKDCSIASANVPLLNAANTFTNGQIVSGASFGLTGNQSASGIFGTNGIRYKNVAGTLNDTTASGTIATNYDSIFGGNTLTANSAVTITNDYGSYFKAPVCSTNVTCTHNYALGVDSFYDAGGATFGGAISGVTTLTASNDIYIPSGTTYGLSTNTGTQDALVTMQAGYGNANFGIGNLQSGDAVVFSRGSNGIEIQNMGYSGAYMLQAGAPATAGGSVGLAYVNSTTLEITTSASSFNASGTIEAATGIFGGVSQTDSCTVCGTIGYLSGNLYEAATTASTSYTTGAIVDSGGLGVAGNIYVGGNLSGTGMVGSTSSYLFATTAAKPNILIGIGGSNYGQIGNVGAHSWFAGFGGSTSIIGTTDVVWFDNGDVNIGNSTAIATSATGGFFGLPTSNGAPTGTPTNAAAGVSQCEINYASQNLNCYINGGWYHVAMTSGAN